MSWSNQTKSSTIFSDQSKSSISFSNDTKHSSSFSNTSKNTSTFTDQAISGSSQNLWDPGTLPWQVAFPWHYPIIAGSSWVDQVKN